MRVEYEVIAYPSGTVIDGNRVSPLLQQIKEPIASFTGDKGYDQSTVYNHVLHHSIDAQIIIHPRSNAVISDRQVC